MFSSPKATLFMQHQNVFNVTCHMVTCNAHIVNLYLYSIESVATKLNL